jgi:hypothetical protein
MGSIDRYRYALSQTYLLSNTPFRTKYLIQPRI